MTTKLKAPVRRVTPIVTDHRLRPRESDRVTVTLYPNGVIGFRAYRCRLEYTLPLSRAYAMAADAHRKEAQKKGNQNEHNAIGTRRYYRPYRDGAGERA